MVCDVELEALLPQLAAVQGEGLEAGTGLIRITARTRDGIAVACPDCGRSSDWEHSRYVRHVTDEAVGGRPVLIDLSVRRLYCENPDCPKTTFAEQVDGLTAFTGESPRWWTRWRGCAPEPALRCRSTACSRKPPTSVSCTVPALTTRPKRSTGSAASSGS
ncbi:transposase family protein [Streptomyces sp. NPDC002928]|uniref:transposase family protein n=1 Tax=Streptomyces sp. NPDC002928 TaxID=3154440 RepID=UPI0033AC5936